MCTERTENRDGHTRLYRQTEQCGYGEPSSAGPTRRLKLPGPVGRADASDQHRGLDLHGEGWAAGCSELELAEFNALPQTKMTRDIHCVTAWSKLNTLWEGVLIDDLLGAADLAPPTAFALAHSYDGYSTNVPLADLTGGKAMVATKFAGQPVTAEHGGPARLLVPHLYFWKSAKWVNALQFTERDELGFWELRGYHRYGDPWREQRYRND